jgi:phosphomannomutase
MTDKISPVKCGTDGWRGVIADYFTFENVRIAAAAIANYVCDEEKPATGVCIGYDTRFGSRAFAGAVAEVIASAGIRVWMADRVTPTPAVSYAVRQLGCAGGVMITSSHNPYQWNGVKYKASYGGPARPAIIAAVEARLGKPLNRAQKAAPIEARDFQTPYIQALREFVELPDRRLRFPVRG